MKRYFFYFVALFSLIFVSCTTKPSTPVKNTVGDAYDVLVLCDDEPWSGDLAMAVCDLLEEDMAGLTRPQGYFDIVKQIAPSKASDFDKKYGNILVVSINPSCTESTSEVVYNRYAYPQTIVVLSAPSSEAAVEYINSSAQELRGLFEKAICRQSNSYYAARPAEQLIVDFKNHTGFDMLIPQNFYKANTRDQDLLWYLRDYANKAQYIFAYSYPYTDASDLTVEWLMRSLDNKLSTISSKGAAGSYMGVNENGPAELREVTIGNREWLELRGWWEVTNDFMGGPFVSFSTLDEATQQITTVMFALYAPEDPQRNLLRELEYLIYTTAE